MSHQLPKCLICENVIPNFEMSKDSIGIEGGYVTIEFGYGSQYDCIGVSQPVYPKDDEQAKEWKWHITTLHSILGDKSGFSDKKIYVMGTESTVYRKPCDEVTDMATKIAGHDAIECKICDKCFKEKCEKGLISGRNKLTS